MSTALPWQLRVPSASLADSFGLGPWSSRSTRLWRHHRRPMRALTRLTHFPLLTRGGFLRNMVNCFLLNRRWWASKYRHELKTQLGKSVCGVHSGRTRVGSETKRHLPAVRTPQPWRDSVREHRSEHQARPRPVPVSAAISLSGRRVYFGECTGAAPRGSLPCSPLRAMRGSRACSADRPDASAFRAAEYTKVAQTETGLALRRATHRAAA
jgi:hypothetical protein